MNTDHEHGEQQKKQSRWGFRGMTFRDWLPIIGTLLIPVMVAAGSGWIIWHQGKIEGLRAEAERKLAEQRAQDEALQSYLDQMSMLMLEKHLRKSEEDSEVRTLAQARTLTVIRRVDTSRKDEIMRFLLEADLVHRVGGMAPVIELGGADLSGTDLNGANLNSVHLGNADLSNVDLRGTDLSGADLSGANLSGANGVTNEQLSAAKSLKDAIMPNGQKYEDWRKDKEGSGKDEKNE